MLHLGDHIRNNQNIIAQSAGAVEYTDCFSAEGYPPTSVLDMTLNNLMVKFQ